MLSFAMTNGVALLQSFGTPIRCHHCCQLHHTVAIRKGHHCHLLAGPIDMSSPCDSSTHNHPTCSCQRWRPYAHINTYCMTYICDIPIIPCIHHSINAYVQSWVLALHIIYRSWIHGLQVYRSTAKCLQTQSTDLYTCSIQLVYRGIQVYRSTGFQVYSLRIP